jgi:hypothetical protein
LGHTGVKTEVSTRCCKVLSVCCTAVVLRMFFNH